MGSCVFPIALSEHHAFYTSSFVLDTCSGRRLFSNVVKGRYFAIFLLRDLPKHLKKCTHRSVRSFDDTRCFGSHVSGTPQSLSRWFEFPSHLSISKLMFSSEMIMEERCRHKRKGSSVPRQLNPPVIMALSNGKDARAPGTGFSRALLRDHLCFLTCLLPFLSASPLTLGLALSAFSMISIMA